jgi:hypothetical protein
LFQLLWGRLHTPLKRQIEIQTHFVLIPASAPELTQIVIPTVTPELLKRALFVVKLAKADNFKTLFLTKSIPFTWVVFLDFVALGYNNIY